MLFDIVTLSGLPQFSKYKNRVLAAGGTLIDESYTKAQIVALKNSGLYDKASLITIPGAGKSGTLFNLKPSNADFSFSRNSVKWVLGKSGLLEQVAANVPAFEYDAATGRYNLLMEPQRTNLIQRSSDFSTYWTISNRMSIQTNAAISPDGVINATKMKCDSTAANTHFLFLVAFAITSGAYYTYSFYLKAAELSWVRMRMDATTTKQAYFNIAAGTIGTVSAGVTATITHVGYGWYRCSISAVSDGATASLKLYLAQGDNNDTFDGDGNSGIYIWGAQMEAGAYQSSYIQTSGSTVTRLVDYTIISGLQSKGLITPNNFTFFVDINVIARDNAGSNTQLIFETSSSEDVFGIQFNKLNPSQKSGYYFTAAQAIGSFTSGDKVAVSYGGGVCKVFVAGVLIGQASINLSTIDVLHTNSTSWLSNALMRQMAFFTTTLTDSECITLTT